MCGVGDRGGRMIAAAISRMQTLVFLSKALLVFQEQMLLDVLFAFGKFLDPLNGLSYNFAQVCTYLGGKRICQFLDATIGRSFTLPNPFH